MTKKIVEFKKYDYRLNDELKKQIINIKKIVTKGLQSYKNLDSSINGEKIDTNLDINTLQKIKAFNINLDRIIDGKIINDAEATKYLNYISEIESKEDDITLAFTCIELINIMTLNKKILDLDYEMIKQYINGISTSDLNYSLYEKCLKVLLSDYVVKKIEQFSKNNNEYPIKVLIEDLIFEINFNNESDKNIDKAITEIDDLTLNKEEKNNEDNILEFKFTKLLIPTMNDIKEDLLRIMKELQSIDLKSDRFSNNDLKIVMDSDKIERLDCNDYMFYPINIKIIALQKSQNIYLRIQQIISLIKMGEDALKHNKANETLFKPINK